MKERRIEIDWKAATLGAGIGCLSLVLLAAGAAGLLAGERVGMEALGYLSAGVLVGSSMLAGLAAAHGGPASSAAAVLGELAALFVLDLLLNGGQVEGMGYTILALTGGCGAAILLTVNRGRGGAHRRRRRKNRYSAQRPG